MPWKQSLALLGPQQSGWVSHFASSRDWIVTSPGPADATVPDLKPVVEGDWWVLRVGSDILERFIDGLEDDANG